MTATLLCGSPRSSPTPRLPAGGILSPTAPAPRSHDVPPPSPLIPPTQPRLNLRPQPLRSLYAPAPIAARNRQSRGERRGAARRRLPAHPPHLRPPRGSGHLPAAGTRWSPGRPEGGRVGTPSEAGPARPSPGPLPPRSGPRPAAPAPGPGPAPHQE